MTDGAAKVGETGPTEPHPLNGQVDANTVRVLITGICAVLEHQDDWLVIAPDGGPAHRSRNYEDRVIPRHTSWLLAKSETVHPDSRPETFHVKDYSVFILDRERLIFRTRQPIIRSLRRPDEHAIHLQDVCPHLTIAPVYASLHPGGAVSAQLKLPHVELEQAAQTELEFEFRPRCPDITQSPATRQISHIGGISIPVGEEEFYFESAPFDDVPPLKPIRFRALSDGEATGGTLIVFGNTPIDAVEKWIANSDDTPSEEGPDVDFELYYGLAANDGNSVLTIPFGRMPRTQNEVQPTLPRVGNCPYAIAMLAGDSTTPMTKRA